MSLLFPSFSGQLWNFTVDNPHENCLHEINDTDVAGCTVFFSICKPLPKSVCGASAGNVSFCQVVTSTDGTKYYYNIGSYSTKHSFIALSKCQRLKYRVHF